MNEIKKMRIREKKTKFTFHLFSRKGVTEQKFQFNRPKYSLNYVHGDPFSPSCFSCSDIFIYLFTYLFVYLNIDLFGMISGRRGVPYAVYHFSTSGAAVAVATAITHPLGFLSFLSPIFPSEFRNRCLR